MYEMVNGFIVYPWSEEREERIEYLLRSDREIADKMVHLMNVHATNHAFEFGEKSLKITSLFSIPRIKRFFKSQRICIYFDAVSRRLWREHEELEEWSELNRYPTGEHPI